MIKAMPIPVHTPYVTSRTYIFGENVEAIREIPVNIHPVMYTARRPNLFVKLAAIGPNGPHKPIRIVPRSDITVVSC